MGASGEREGGLVVWERFFVFHDGSCAYDHTHRRSRRGVPGIFAHALGRHRDEITAACISQKAFLLNYYPWPRSAGGLLGKAPRP